MLDDNAAYLVRNLARDGDRDLKVVLDLAVVDLCLVDQLIFTAIHGGVGREVEAQRRLIFSGRRAFQRGLDGNLDLNFLVLIDLTIDDHGAGQLRNEFLRLDRALHVLDRGLRHILRVLTDRAIQFRPNRFLGRSTHSFLGNRGGNGEARILNDLAILVTRSDRRGVRGFRGCLIVLHSRNRRLLRLDDFRGIRLVIVGRHGLLRDRLVLLIRRAGRSRVGHDLIRADLHIVYCDGGVRNRLVLQTNCVLAGRADLLCLITVSNVVTGINIERAAGDGDILDIDRTIRIQNAKSTGVAGDRTSADADCQRAILIAGIVGLVVHDHAIATEYALGVAVLTGPIFLTEAKDGAAGDTQLTCAHHDAGTSVAGSQRADNRTAANRQGIVVGKIDTKGAIAIRHNVADDITARNSNHVATQATCAVVHDTGVIQSRHNAAGNGNVGILTDKHTAFLTVNVASRYIG